MKILIISSDYCDHIGGKSTHISMLTKGLEFNGHSVQFICLKRNFVTKLVVGISGKIFDLFGMGIFVRHFMMRKLLKISVKKVFSENNFDVVNVEDVNSLFVIFELSSKIPKILTIHGELARELKVHGYVKRPLEYNLFLALEKNAYKIANYIVAVDTRIKEHIENLVPEANQKIKVIYNFIDVISFQKELNMLSAEKVKCQFNIPLDCKVVLVPRRLTEKCGVIYAVKAAEILIKKYRITNIRFLIVGDGLEYKNISNYIKTNNLQNWVVLIGRVNYCNMPKYYKIAEVVALPSISVGGYKEATSLAVLESMAAKVPVVASNIGGLAEIIKDKETGFLVAEKSSDAMANTIKTILESSIIKERVVSNAFNYVANNHCYENVTRIFVNIYTETIRNLK